MIDFRYHIVSLVSVFIALAIGVVLGAGPLREAIGDTLTTQVDALRRDKENLQLAVANRDQQIQQRDSFVAEVAPELVGEQLAGRSVVAVALPSASSDTVDALAAQAEAAGAAVTGTVSLTPAWTDPAGAQARGALADELAQQVGPRLPTGTGTSDGLSTALSWAIAGPDPADPEGAVPADPDPGAATVLEELRDGGLLTVDGDPAQRANLVLVVAGAPDPEVAPEEAAQWLPVVQALDAASGGAVVAGPITAAADGGVVAAVRDSDAADTVSTVDAADTSIGQVVAVLALREQVSGVAGHYGFAEGSSAVLPELGDPAPAP